MTGGYGADPIELNKLSKTALADMVSHHKTMARRLRTAEGQVTEALSGATGFAFGTQYGNGLARICDSEQDLAAAAEEFQDAVHDAAKRYELMETEAADDMAGVLRNRGEG